MLFRSLHKEGEADYRPQLIEYEGEGEPYAEFVSADEPTVTRSGYAGELLLSLDRTRLVGIRVFTTPAVPVPVTIGDTAISARFTRLYGICRRILWTDASTPAIGNEQTRAALADLAEFLFSDGIDAAHSKPVEQG